MNKGFYTGSFLTTPTTPTVAVEGISLSESSVVDEIGQTLQLVATISPANATNKSVIWTTSDASVATVSPAGLVTFAGGGWCTITATSSDGGFTDTCDIQTYFATFEAVYNLGEGSVGLTQLLDSSGQRHHLTAVGGWSLSFINGFALQAGTKYPYDPELGAYTGLNYGVGYIAYPAHSLAADQYVSAPEGDIKFISIDTDEQFYDNGTPVNVNIADIYDNNYLTLTIADNVLISIHIQ